MFNMIGQVLKYSALTLLVLVLSHIIQIRGTTISQHVDNSLNWIAGIKPKREITRVTQELSSSVSGAIRARSNNAESIPDDDQRQLRHVIQKAQH